jgi:hypothetical protein
VAILRFPISASNLSFSDYSRDQSKRTALQIPSYTRLDTDAAILTWGLRG